MEIKEVSIAKIRVAKGRRAVKPRRVCALSDSICRVGLMNPIGLTADHVLIHGRHRLAAYIELGRDTIPAVIHNLKGLHAELAEIDENIERANLTALQHSQALKRRKEIYEALYPETKAGGDRKSSKAKSKAQNGPLKSFTEDTAAKTGKSVSQVKRDVAIATNIPGDLQEAIADTHIANNKSELAKLGKLNEAVQREVVDLIVTGEADSVDDATMDVCPNCGHDEFDDDGDCEKCHEPTGEQDDTITIGPFVHSVRSMVWEFVSNNPEFVTPIVDALRELADDTEKAG